MDEREIALEGFSDHWLDKKMQLDPSQYGEQVKKKKPLYRYDISFIKCINVFFGTRCGGI